MPESRSRRKPQKTRYQLEPARKKPSKGSPKWFGPLMLAIMGIGVAIIVWNYTRGDATSNTVLIVGLGLIAVGFFGVTFWK
jgi:cell division protein CrgA